MASILIYAQICTELKSLANFATMASETATASSMTIAATFLVHSVVRGHHVYKAVWTQFVGEELNLKREFYNEYDCLAVEVTSKTDGRTVGRVPREISNRLWKFLRDGGRIVCEIVGKRKKGKG